MADNTTINTRNSYTPYTGGTDYTKFTQNTSMAEADRKSAQTKSDIQQNKAALDQAAQVKVSMLSNQSGATSELTGTQSGINQLLGNGLFSINAELPQTTTESTGNDTATQTQQTTQTAKTYDYTQAGQYKSYTGSKDYSNLSKNTFVSNVDQQTTQAKSDLAQSKATSDQANDVNTAVQTASGGVTGQLSTSVEDINQIYGKGGFNTTA